MMMTSHGLHYLFINDIESKKVCEGFRVSSKNFFWAADSCKIESRMAVVIFQKSHHDSHLAEMFCPD